MSAKLDDKTLEQSPRAKQLGLADIIANLLVTHGLSLSISKPAGQHCVAVLTSTTDRKRAAVGTASSPSEAMIAAVGEFLGKRRHG